MLIKHKLIVNTAVCIVALLFMLALLLFTLNASDNDLKIAKGIAAVESGVLQLRRHEKDFLARKDLKYVEKFRSEMTALNNNLDVLEQDFASISVSLSEIDEIKSVFSEYLNYFNQLVSAQQVIGLHAKDGLYGELRQRVHEVETLIGKNDFELLSGMLQLRRNEKDFMLRLDDKYVTRLNNNTDKLIDLTQNSQLAAERKTNIKQLLNSYRQAFLNLAEQQERLGYNAEQGIQGQMRATVHQVNSKLEKLMAASQKQNDAHRNFVFVTALAIFSVITVLVLALAWYISRKIHRSIKQLKLAMEQVASSQDLSISASEQGNDELAEMAVVFNKMLSNFRHLIGEVNQSVTTVNTATVNLAQNIELTNQGVNTQVQETDLVATAVTEMVATVEEIANNTTQAAERAELANTNALQGQHSVSQTLSQIELLSTQLSDSEQVVQELAQDSETIGTVLDVIRGIAEQTNLLALNAAIEAARAGEQGRGFAVVADEVRTLASRTQESTQEIENIIESLRRRTKTIVQQMSDCRQQGQDSAAQASSAGELLQEIASGVAKISDMNTAIATAIHQQSLVAADVNKHVINIRDVAEQSGISAADNTRMSEELSQQAQDLQVEVSQFKV